MKAIIITIIISAWGLFTWILIRAAGLASRQEEEWWDHDKIDEKNE